MTDRPAGILGLRTALYPAPDLAAARQWYATVLGRPPYFDQPYSVGFNVGGFELGLVPDLAPGTSGPQPLWGVADAAAAWADLRGYGIVPELPEAACQAGLAYLANAPPDAKAGTPAPPKVVVGGAGAGTMVGTAPIVWWLGGGAASLGVTGAYGDPTRGYAGAYEGA